MRGMLTGLFSLSVALIVVPVLARADQSDPAKVVFSLEGFWRGHYMLATPMVRDENGVRELLHKCRTPAPPAKWMQSDFDDTEWLRLCGQLFPFSRGSSKIAQDYLGPTYDQNCSPCLSLICVRGRFVVTDPRSVGDLTLDVKYRGGVAVYLNGREVARRHLAPDSGPKDLAEDYPPEAFLHDGKILSSRKKPELLTPRVREMSGIRIPASAMRKGVNVIAIEVHRSAYSAEFLRALKRQRFKRYFVWATCALIDAKLSARKTTGVTQNFVRPRGMQIWNSQPLATDFDMDYAPVGESLRPIRIVATRGGAFSGKVVVGSSAAITGLSARAGALSGPGGSTIPASCVQVRWALPGRLEGNVSRRYGLRRRSVLAFDTLAEAAQGEVAVAIKGDRNAPDTRSGAVQPIWVTVDVPAGAEAGLYSGELTVTAGDWKVYVPISLKVCDWQMPDTQDWLTFVELIQSPETLAIQYKVDPWSDEHFACIARTFRLTGQVGAKTVYVPLIAQTNLGNTESMVRWKKAKTPNAYAFDLSVMKRYLDLVEKHQGKPLRVIFYVWDVYLEGGFLRYSNEGKYARPDIHNALAKLKDKGPRVTMLGVHGKTEKLQLPTYSQPEGSGAHWVKLFAEIKAEMKRRGLASAMALGIANDAVPTREVAAFFDKVAPGVPWVQHAHSADKRLTCSLTELVWSPRFQLYPDVESKMGWKRADLFVQFPRNVTDAYPLTTFRLMAEMNIIGGNRGVGRMGADFWRVLTDKQGRKVATLSNRWPFVDWRNLTIKTTLLAPGPDGALATHRFEMMREGLQETEARIFIEQAVDAGKVTGQLARRCRRTLEDRAGAVQLGLQNHFTCGVAKETCHAWWNNPGQVGYRWYVSSEWQRRSADLFTLASDVAKAIGARYRAVRE